MPALLTLVSISSFGYTPPGSGQPSVSELLQQDSIVQKAKADFETYAEYVYTAIDEPDLSYEAFRQGLIGYHNLEKRGEIERLDTLTIIDFSKPSSEPRMFIIDLCHQKVFHKSLCSHGVNSGRLYPKSFSNENNSHKSSIGFYVTTSTYSGKFDLALRLKGMEYSNSHASSRGVVMHGADYASYEFLDKNDCQLGRSYGCPALPHKDFDQVVSWIKEGSCLFIYYPSKSYKKYSKYLSRKDYLVDFVEY
ncbi:murein L,D-transpeptidase catalytic domain family protein [Paracrocinitomix mangrovi]|uniref:murein L,D-transpeptidase catalytic domain family protein n=1 Tax=Paracrocinitomix mangrovi TaxID=2862509 RepID=UPI001C8DE231|nr:murein L,D-transpeptidase catalytic domain family protein [Paracrocinitomix mangrovi]UKN01844.1 murein L,D-transpeptidase catalytic domain family protein [Paracrocinitomix mangrovi]